MDKIIIAAGFLLIAFALYRTIRRFTGRPGSCCGGPEAVSVSAERFESALREKSYTLEGFREISGPDRP